MSLSVVPTQTVAVMDPKVRINSKRVYAVLKGSSVNSWQVFPATTINNSQIQITCNPPNRDIIINRKCYLRATFTLTFTGTGNPLLRMDGADAPRAYGLAQCISSLQMTVNNDTISQAPLYQYFPALLHYHNKVETRREEYSMTPSMLDQSQEYNPLFQTVRSPLRGYRDSVSAGDEGRAGFPMIINNGNNTATVQLTITEPVWLSPFLFGEGEASGLVGVQNMSFSATLGNLQRLWSHDATNGNSLSALSVSLDSAALLFNYMTPNPIEPIPRAISYPYFNIVSYPTKYGSAVSAGSSVSIVMSNVQLTSIPRRCYIFARDDDAIYQANGGYTYSDSFLSLSGSANPVRVSWNNNQFLAGASIQDLYELAVKNGCSISYPSWVGALTGANFSGTSSVSTGIGSVLCLEFGTDIGLNPTEAPGLLGNYQFSLTADFKNISQRSITPTLYVVMVYEGVFNCIDGSCSHSIGVLTQKDVLEAPVDPNMTYKQVENVYGGDFWGDLWSGVKEGAKVLKDVGEAALPYAPMLLGAGPSYSGGVGVAGGKKKGRKGGVLLGAGMASRRDLMSRLH
jgi:hypothetical protein